MEPLTPSQIAAIAHQVVGHGAEGLVCHNLTGRVRFANSHACTSLGYPFEDMVTKSIADYTPEWSEEWWGQHCKRTLDNGNDSLFTYHCNQKGTSYPVEMRSIPHIISDTNEQLICTLIRRAQHTKRYISMLEHAETSHRIGSFDLNVLDQTIIVSANLFAMMGTQQANDLRPSRITERLSQEDAARWSAELVRFLEGFHRMDETFVMRAAAGKKVLMQVVMWSRMEAGLVTGITGHYQMVEQAGKEGMISLEESQRRHIIRALRYTNGRVTGPNGAGRLLKINGKTLFARMKKLKINREDYTNR
ncbi:PAS domain-containing protein [Lewinella sp. IMCC34183]|uniref:PAS domain-containing protein n=1 Tax=Lewinella sp. IMCC34183 TaxID=2248762 RepID=UPI000E257867|nr:PAS domain-containing protein [Lewinella sp. IMCC34183]